MNRPDQGFAGAASVAPPASALGEVWRYFFRLGWIAFGGPAAHIAIMRRELVQERRWVSDEEFVDMLGVTNLIPGPNSTEMTMALGARRAGFWGLWLAGAAFIGPAVAIVLALAWAYVRWGATPAGEAIIYGIQPFVLAIIVQAIWGLRGAAVRGPATAIAGVVVLALAVVGVGEVWLILGSGLALMALGLLAGRAGPGAGQRRRWPRPRGGGVRKMRALVPLPLPLLASGDAAPYSLWGLFLVFLKIGAVLYGSGYVLVAFLNSDLVEARGWLTEEQLLDAIAVGQFTPGPLFSSATFAGYVVDGLPGAAVATLGIFIPSFLLVTVAHPFAPRLRRSRWAAPFLDGVNVAALALMAFVTVTLARETLDSWYTGALFAVAAWVLVRFSPNSVWLVLAGAAAGVVHAWLW